MASAPVEATLNNPLRVRVGGHNHLVVVTNRADEAGEWVRRLGPPVAGTTRIIGFSFHRHEDHRADGFVTRRVDSIHLAFLARVLIYHLASAEGGMYSPEVMSFLRQAGNLFAGGDVDEGLYLLGAPFRRTVPRTMDLVEVANVCDVGHLVDGANQAGVPLHVVLGRAVLGIPEGGLRADGGGETWDTWPLTHEQVEVAVQSVAIAQILGLRAYLRTNIPALPL